VPSPDFCTVHRVKHAGGGLRPDAGKQLQHAKAGNTIARVFEQAQEGEHIFDVRRLEKLEPAELHVRDIAWDEFEFEQRAMARGTEQDGLRLQRNGCLASLQYLIGHITGLLGFVCHGDNERPLLGPSFAPKLLAEALGRQADAGMRIS